MTSLSDQFSGVNPAGLPAFPGAISSSWGRLWGQGDVAWPHGMPRRFVGNLDAVNEPVKSDPLLGFIQVAFSLRDGPRGS